MFCIITISRIPQLGISFCAGLEFCLPQPLPFWNQPGTGKGLMPAVSYIPVQPSWSRLENSQDKCQSWLELLV